MSVRSRRALRAGVISDTHGLMRPEALAALHGSDVILHAGDIGGADILAALEAIAPVTAIRGNNDGAAWASAIPEHRTIDLNGAKIYLLHDRNELDRYPPPESCDVIVTGHSHRPLVERRDGVLYLNPGSAGPRRFRLPVTIAHLTLGREVDAEVVTLFA